MIQTLTTRQAARAIRAVQAKRTQATTTGRAANLRVAHDEAANDLLGSANLHTAKASRAELSAGGFSSTVVHGVMGGAWLAHDIDELWKNEASRGALMNTMRLLDTNEEIIGLSGHLLTVSKSMTRSYCSDL